MHATDFSSQYTLLVGVGFNGERCKLREFIWFLYLGHVTYKYGHDYQNWRQPLKEQTRPQTNPGELRKPKIRRLEFICSNHFVVKGLPLKLCDLIFLLDKEKNKEDNGIFHIFYLPLPEDGQCHSRLHQRRKISERISTVEPHIHVSIH